MIYLDYSATTPVEESVLNSFVETTKKMIGNPNSLHKLGTDAKALIDAATKQIASILGVKKEEIIYTSGASEANNTAIKGICLKYQNRGKHIITTRLEHSSVIEPLNYLKNLGFEIEYVNLTEDGKVDLDDLKKKKLYEIKVTPSIPTREVGIVLLDRSIPNYSALKLVEIMTQKQS